MLRLRGLGTELRLVLILGGLCVALFLVGIGFRPIWDIDEGMHATTAKEMVLTGDWITPTFNGEKFHDKPVLFNWLTALSFLLLGFNAFAARLPGALMGIGSVALVYFLGKRQGGPTLGFLSGAILATSPMFITLSQAVVHDIVLVFFVTLALVLFYFAYTEIRHRQARLILSYVAVGLAVLTKGPVGIVLCGLTIGSFLLLRRKVSFLKEMKLGWGLVIVILVAAPWYVTTSLRNPEYLNHFFIHQNFLNFVSSKAARHPEPFYYYAPILMGGFFPWSIMLPIALVRPFWNSLKRVDEATLYLIVWFASVFLFFSAASSKLGPYILPLFPPAALLVGRLWHELLNTATANLRKAFTYGLGVLSFGMVGGLVYLFTNQPEKLPNSYGVDLLWVNGLSLFLSLATIGAFALILMRRYRDAFAANVTMILIGVLFFTFVIAPAIAPYRSSKHLALVLDRIAPRKENVVFFRKVRESVLFYTNRRASVLNKPAELLDYLEGSRDHYAVISRHHLRMFPNIRLLSEIVAEDGTDVIIRSKPLRPQGNGAGPQ